MGRRSPNRRLPKYLRDQQPDVQPRHALPADITQQEPGINDYRPLSYVDKEFVCCDCHKKEVWTAEDQKWWYEVAKGSLNSTAVRCRECRLKRREQHGGTPKILQIERAGRRQEAKADEPAADPQSSKGRQCRF